ncbi:hypothetical protein NDU88_006608 [Pleurodeles waltl]|uniref:Integrase catalytic domain-containing protein n=1 Tax=Pleurodeles waltl TaxID=8319 RepID=A0AAV7MCQ4_PLEWA|nr:hypothetical protein NDU88_006608 [Pleurodeles waltl]
MGPIVEENMEWYIIVVVDYFSKWPEIKIVTKANPVNVLMFLDELFQRERLPKKIITDNGVQFKSEEIEEFLKRNGIEHKLVSVDHPSGNGEVVRFNRVIKDSLQLARYKNVDWKTCVKKMIWMYRTSSTVTGHTLFTVMRGRIPFTKDNQGWLSKSRMKEWSPVEVKKNIQKAQGLYKNFVDLKSGAKEINLKKGDVVYVKLPGKVKKRRYQTSEPKTVLEIYKNSAKLSDGRVWHMSRFARFRGDSTDVDGNISAESTNNYFWLDTVHNDIPTGMEDLTGAEEGYSAYEGAGVNNDISAPEARVINDNSAQSEKNRTYKSKLGRVVKKPAYLKDYVVY